jgi:hypothetical protein
MSRSYVSSLPSASMTCSGTALALKAVGLRIIASRSPQTGRQITDRDTGDLISLLSFFGNYPKSECGKLL